MPTLRGLIEFCFEYNKLGINNNPIKQKNSPIPVHTPPTDDSSRLKEFLYIFITEKTNKRIKQNLKRPSFVSLIFITIPQSLRLLKSSEPRFNKLIRSNTESSDLHLNA